MINTIFHFVNDPTFDYQTAVNNGDISEYTIVFNSADHSIHCKGAMFGRMSRADMAETLGNISDLIPVATDSTLGGIKIGYTNDSDQNSRRYGVVLDSNNKAYVEVPWSDTITPDFDDTELKNLIATERGRIDNFISNLSATIDAKNRELYADGDWVREIFGNAQDPGSVAAAYRKEIDDYLSLFDVWEYIDPEHPELGRKARIVELQNTADGLTHRIGEAETSISGSSVAISTLTHDLSGLTSTVTTISDNLDTVTRKESALEQTVDSIGLRVTSSEGDISTLQTKEASLEVKADKIQSRVVDTENSINGCYKVTIVQSPSNAASAVDVSTISAAVAARTSLSNNQLINDEDFTTAPTADTLYKNGVPQYFTFSRYKGLTVRASSLEQTADSITARVGTVEGSLNDPTTGLITRTSTLEQTASSLDARVGSVEQQANTTDTALAALTLEVTGTNDVKESLSSLSSSVSTYENNNDTNLGNLIKMAASVLELKSSQDAQGYLSSTADVASAITDGSFTGYSGLASKVQEIDGAYVSQASLTTQLQALDVSGQIATATSGLASESYVRTTAASEADDAESAAKGYADTVAASATATMYATVDEVCAGIGVTVTKDTDGAYTSVAQISADNINLNGQTNFKTAVGAFIKTDVLEAGTATIDAATINSADITGTLNGVNGVFSGELSAATGSFTGMVTATGGSFTGNVNATQFIAGDEDGLNVTVNGNAISFNHGSDQRAWFTTLDENGNDTDGMFLYIKNPDQTATNKVITIDFTNLTFKNVGSNQQTAVQQTDIYTTITGTNVQYTSSIFKGSVDGLYYSNSQLSTLLSSTQSSTHYKYVKESYVILSNNSVYRLYKVKIYDKVTFSSGTMTTGGGYYAILYDTSGSVLNGTEAYGSSSSGTIYNPNSTVKTGSGSSNVSTQFSTSNNYIYPYVAVTTGQTGKKITLYRIVSTQYSTIITNEQDLTLHS